MVQILITFGAYHNWPCSEMVLIWSWRLCLVYMVSDVYDGVCSLCFGWFIGSHCDSFVDHLLVVFMIQYCPHCSVLMKLIIFGDLQILTHLGLG